MDSDTDSDPGDQWSTNVEQPADESAASWRTANSRFSSDRTASGSEASSEFDTATSRLSTGSHPGSIDDPPENPQPAPDHPPPLGPESPPSTFYTPPSSPQPSIDNSNPQLAPDDSHPPPSNPAPSTGPHQPTDNHPPPDMEPQHPGTSVFGSFLNKLMKGKFKRHISVYGYENLAQRELQGTVGPGSYVFTPSLPLLSMLKPSK